MSGPQIEIQLIAMVTSVACAIPGVFLVLRRMALLSDAISHAILLGIVIAFFVTHDLNSPILLLGAAATGVLTATLVEMLQRTRLLKEDAAIGLVFPVLFSIGVLLISRYAGQVHLDLDMVLLGEVAFAPFDRASWLGVDLGPSTLVTMTVILLGNLALVLGFYKELKLATFDAGLSAALGFSPALVHYGLMSSVSITAVGAFDAVGAILVVALMIAPASAAYLLTDDLAWMLVIASGIGVVSAISGYWVAHGLDASIAGSMASMAGVLFLVVYVAAPHRGLVAVVRRRRGQRASFSRTMLAIHLFQHEGAADEAIECRLDHLTDHLRWSPHDARRIVREAEDRRLVTVAPHGGLRLTDRGRELAREVVVR